jgi:hypothetical protein
MIISLLLDMMGLRDCAFVPGKTCTSGEENTRYLLLCAVNY